MGIWARASAGHGAYHNRRLLALLLLDKVHNNLLKSILVRTPERLTSIVQVLLLARLLLLRLPLGDRVVRLRLLLLLRLRLLLLLLLLRQMGFPLLAAGLLLKDQVVHLEKYNTRSHLSKHTMTTR